MKQRIISFIILIGFAASTLSACASIPGNTHANASAEDKVNPTPFQPEICRIWISPAVPEALSNALTTSSTIQAAESAEEADFSLFPLDGTYSGSPLTVAQWVYALVAPFYTIRDGLSFEEFKSIWQGTPSEELAAIRLEMTESTRTVFETMFGKAAMGVIRISPAEALLDRAWNEKDLWAILPFEEIQPKWKVMKIDGMSPLDRPMDEARYPFTVRYGLISTSDAGKGNSAFAQQLSALIPATNRDESRMTVLVMSGTTAMARGTAYKIDVKGVDYVIEAVKDWFLTADIRHVSNEVSFNSDCPKADPFNTGLQFCSDPDYIEVLKGLGINVVEVTGNHENDYGADKFAETLKVYDEQGWTVFGGGDTPAEAQKPVFIENNGNKIAFIGCNPVGPTQAWATEERAGAAKCDFDYYFDQIKQLKAQGYVVVATYQHQEIYKYMYDEHYRTDFWNAAESGADIVSGSQAHFPMGFEFKSNALIHYGMGNFLFDQMDYPVEGTRREFIDRHIIYDGKYMNTELLTALLTDYSRPRPMTEEERQQFLTDLFTASGWK